MALHAHNATDRVEQMIFLTRRLRKLIEQETALFEARTPHEAANIAKEKNTLATTYRLESARISKDAGLIADAPTALRTELREETQHLEKALMANHQIAGVVRKLTEGLVHAIAGEAANTRSRMKGYSANGRVDKTDTAVAITLNRQI